VGAWTRHVLDAAEDLVEIMAVGVLLERHCGDPGRVRQEPGRAAWMTEIT